MQGQEASTKRQEDPAVTRDSLQFLAEITPSSVHGSLDFSKYRLFAYPPGIKSFPDEMTPSSSVNLQAELLCPKTNQDRERANPSSNNHESATMREFSLYAPTISTRARATHCKDEHERRIALIQEDGLELEVLKEFRSTQPQEPLTETKSQFLTEVDEIEQSVLGRSAAEMPRPFPGRPSAHEEIDMLLTVAHEGLIKTVVAAKTSIASDANSWAVTKLLDESYYDTLRYYIICGLLILSRSPKQTFVY